MKQAKHLALTAAIAAAFAAPVHALGVSADGTGQVLLYPYYTADAGNQTLFSVSNGTDRVKALRVRLRESRNSRPVMVFNLYLAAHDTWSAAIVAPTAEGAAKLVHNDTSCTVARVTSPLDLRNYAFTGTSSDHPASQDATLGAPSRTHEGLIEIIELGELQAGAGATQLAEEATPGPNGTPQNCAALTAAWSPPNGAWSVNAGLNIDLPQGGLYGSAAVIDVADGTMFAYPATAIAQFYTNAQAPGALHANLPSGDLPNLTSADSGDGVVRVDLPMTNDSGPLSEVLPRFPATANGVSLALMRASIGNEFNTDPTIGAATEWIVTFPTKQYYTDVAQDNQVTAPFTNAFRDDGKSYDAFKVSYTDRSGVRDGHIPEEFAGTPPPPPSLCGTVNVVSFNQGTPAATSILGHKGIGNDVSLRTDAGTPLIEGTAEFDLRSFANIATEHVLVAPGSGRSYFGLPVLSYSVLRVVNANAQPGVLASYGGALPSHGKRVITTP